MIDFFFFRTALNIRSGATMYLSAVVNAVSVFAISLILLQFFKYLPLCVVGSILVVVAIRMVEVEHIVHLWKVDRKMFALSIMVPPPFFPLFFNLLIIINRLQHCVSSVILQQASSSVLWWHYLCSLMLFLLATVISYTLIFIWL